jgi:hypothetical protein
LEEVVLQHTNVAVILGIPPITPPCHTFDGARTDPGLT